MPVRYIGRETSSQGKFLFRILCNLKNFGIGRMLVRKSYLDRWPEPSYYIIKQAFPDLTHPDLKRGHVIATQVFRGKVMDDKKVCSAYKCDWALVPKSEESSFLENKMVYDPVEAPLTVDMPPLMAKLHIESLMKQGIEPGAEDTKLWLKINRGVHNRAKQSDVEQMLEDVPEERLRPPQTWQSKVEIKRQIKKGVLLNRYRLPN